MHEISPSQLAARCRNTQPDDSHEPFCFELFRRAIAEGSSLCWHYLHNQYYSLVRYWVYRRGPPDPDTTDDLTQDALTAFWRSYTPDKVARARGLGDVLAYLKSCAASAVAQARREAKRRVLEAEWDEQVADACISTRSAEASALRQMNAQQLWAIVEARCNDERERIVACLVFKFNLKPGDIVERLPDLFPDVSVVYRVKRNLLARLRRDATLISMRENRQNERLVE
jgi:DNA-directed RNA polymerase specialized sigma24 family protein